MNGVEVHPPMYEKKVGRPKRSERRNQLSLKEGPRSANMESPCIAVSVMVLTTTTRATTNTHYRTKELLWKKMIQQSFRYNLCAMCIVTSFP